MLVTSLTTDAAAGVTGVKAALALEELLVAFTMTSTTMMMMTRPTAPQAIRAPDMRRGPGVG